MIGRTISMAVGRSARRKTIASANFGFRSLAVLVVEDEPLVAMELAAVAEDSGHVVIGPASTCAQALALIAERPPDMALLDGDLNGEKIDSVADALAARATPFAFVSGFAREHLPLAHNARPLAGKPFLTFEIEELLKVLAAERKV